MLQKRYTKMRRTKRKSVIRRPRSGLRSSKPEIKMWTGSYPALEFVAIRTAAASSLLGGKQFLIADFFKNVTVGAGYNQRVGQRIFAKKIQLSFTTYLCPEGNDASCNTGVVRHQVGSAGWDKTAGTGINNFFDETVTYPFTGPNNRKLYKTYKEKIVHFNSAVAAKNSPTGTGIAGIGMVKHYKMNINVNKNIKYSTNSTTPSDESGSYSLFVMAYTPNLPSGTETRLCCSSVRVRLWFTDD